MLHQFLQSFRDVICYLINGVLVAGYVAWEHVAALTILASFLYFTRRTKATHQGWIWVTCLMAALTAFITAAPAPIILAVMSATGVLALQLDRFNPVSLRWRITGSILIYALAALAYHAYQAYMAGIDAMAWAQAIGSQGEAKTLLAQGRAYVDTLATWGLWFILPLGYLSLLAQVLLAHPPLNRHPSDMIAVVRTRESFPDSDRDLPRSER